MPRRAHLSSTLLAALLTLTATTTQAQFPGDGAPTAPPPAQAPFPGQVVEQPAQPAGEPGNLDLNAIDRQAAPTEFGAPAAARAITPQAPAGAVVQPHVPSGSAQPSYGYMHEYGAFKINGYSAEGMFMLSANLPFPDGRRSVDFYQAKLNYVGKYTDPSGISGHIYEAQVGGPVKDRRYFLFGDQDLNVYDGNSNGTRWIVYYNGQGRRTYSATARFYKP